MVVSWADIPELSTCVGFCSAAWLHSWLQSRRNGADPRPSAKAGHIPSRAGPCERSARSPIDADSRLVADVAVTVAVSSGAAAGPITVVGGLVSPVLAAVAVDRRSQKAP